MAVKVRAATGSDITRLVRYVHQAHGESDWSWVPFSAAALRRSIITMLRRRDHHILISENDGEIAGVLFGTVGAVIYGRTLYATDIEFYAHQGGDKLLDAFTEWARSIGAKVIAMGVSNSGREKAKDRFFEIHGFERTGSMHIKRLDPQPRTVK